MTRYEEPMMQCDGDDGYCGASERDYYEQCASAVSGIAITASRRAPGWVTDGDEDYCPNHIPFEA